VGAVTRLFWDGEQRRLGPMLRGHLLLFERRDPPDYPAQAGLRLLLIVLVLELLIGPRMEGLDRIGLPLPPGALRILIMIGLTLVAARWLAGVRLSDVGVLAPNRWRAAEVLYLVQIFVIAGVILFVLFGTRLAGHGPELWRALGMTVLTALLWGVQQELVYRGLLQTELTRRFGAWTGALAANLAFTFGPLHWNYLAGRNPTSAAIMLAAIFAIGLVFAFIYGRTRNVLLVGLMHGIGAVFPAVSALASAG